MSRDEPSQQRWMIAMRGGPGSGKSTVASDLSRMLGWPLIDKDDIRSFLDGPEAGATSYEIMLSVAGRQIDQGLDVICDSPLHAETYARSRDVAEGHGATLLVVEAYCSDETEWTRRVEGHKQDDLPDHRTTDIDEVQAFYEDPDKSRYEIPTKHLRLDTFGAREEITGTALDWLRECGVPTLPRGV